MTVQQQTFDLHLWDLQKQSKDVQSWLQSAYQHNLSKLKQFESAKNQTNNINAVNIVHLFACGKPHGGTYTSREVLKYLLDNGGKLHVPDAYGWLPINYACFFAFPNTVDVLLEAGSPVQNDLLPQPLDSALQSLAQHQNPCAETCARLLLMHDADPKKGLSSDIHWGGVTWLVWAIIAHNFAMAELLFCKGLTSLSQKEKQLLLIRGNAESFAWAEMHGIELLEELTIHHEAYDTTIKARNLYQKELLQKNIHDILLNKNNDEDGDNSGRKKM